MVYCSFNTNYFGSSYVYIISVFEVGEGVHLPPVPPLDLPLHGVVTITFPFTFGQGKRKMVWPRDNYQLGWSDNVKWLQ